MFEYMVNPSDEVIMLAIGLGIFVIGGMIGLIILKICSEKRVDRFNQYATMSASKEQMEVQNGQEWKDNP